MSAVDALNAAFAADPNAIYALLCNRVPCNAELANDPHVVCEATPPLGDTQETYHVGALGLINAVLTANGLPRVAAKYSDTVDEHGRATLLGFVEYPAVTISNAWLSQAAVHNVKIDHKLWIPGMDDELPPTLPDKGTARDGFFGWSSFGYTTGDVIRRDDLHNEVPSAQPDAAEEWSGPPKAWPGPWAKNNLLDREADDRYRRDAGPKPRDDA